MALSTSFLSASASLVTISSKTSSHALVAPARITVSAVSPAGENVDSVSRRQASLATLAAALAVFGAPLVARADEFYEGYKKETLNVIDTVKSTLALERDDPAKEPAVLALKELSNVWVAKYRREKAVAGKPSFSNIYSVLNAISGHYISFGSAYPIPKKRQVRIFEEVADAEKALSRGR